MSSHHAEEIAQLKQAIKALEAQRASLGNAVIEAALTTIREKLALLESLPSASEQQRKQITILFIDVVGSTQLAQQRDPEEVAEILDAALMRLAGPVERYGGKVTRFQGDGFLAIFGLPVARENDPEQAIRAGLEIQEIARRIADELQAARSLEDFQVRVGINTGLVVTGGQTEAEHTLMGSPVNLAARLQAAAPPGELIISQDTYRHVRGIFDVEALESIHAKGFSEPVQCYLVKRANPRAFHQAQRGIEGIQTRLIGREIERMRIDTIQKMVMEKGETQTVLVVGEAGLGKSRLVFEFDHSMELLSEGVFYFKGRAHPSMQNLSYSLLRDLFSFRFQIMDNDPIHIVREKMENGIAEMMNLSAGSDKRWSEIIQADNAEEAMAEIKIRAQFIGQLLGFDFIPSAYLSGGEQQSIQVRDRALAYLFDYFKSLAHQHPVVMLLEDIHWADDSSLEALATLITSVKRLPLLVIATTRPELFERRPYWGQGQPFHTRLDLHPLNEPESRQLVNEILQRVKSLPEDLSDLIVARAEGNPFYIEELIKVLIEGGVIQKGEAGWQVEPTLLTQIPLPSTLAGVLQARLETLDPDERITLQQASVIGRIFWEEAIEFLNTQGQRADQHSPGVNISQDFRLERSDTRNMDQVSIKRLQIKELIFPHGESAFAATREYIFKHALLRDVAYESVLKRQRRFYHARVASWLEQTTQTSKRGDEYAAVIAEHYNLANESQSAAIWYRRAGEQAISQFAHEEALRCLNRALELISPDQDQLRYDLLLDREKVYNRLGDRHHQLEQLQALKALADRLDGGKERPLGEPFYGPSVPFHQAEVSLRAAMYYTEIGDYPESIASARQAAHWVHGTGMLEVEAKANLALGTALWHHTDYQEAQAALEIAYGMAAQSHLPIVAANSLRLLGALFESRSQYHECYPYFHRALDIFINEGDREGESVVLNSLGVVAYKLGKYADARDYYQRSLRFKREIGNRYGQGITLCNLGIVARKQGDPSGAQDYFSESLRLCREINDLEGEASALAGLGNLATYFGEYVEARTQLEGSVRLCREIGDRQGECNALDDLGLLFCEMGDPAAGILAARNSLVIAREVGLFTEEAHSLTRIGRNYLALGEVALAATSFEDALRLWQGLELEAETLEPLVGLAQIAFANGDHHTAKELIEPVIQFLEEHGIQGVEEPFRDYLLCYRILQSIGDPRAQAVLDKGYIYLMEQAGQIRDEIRKRSFLENVPNNRDLLSEKDTRKGA